jgi:RES domain-containing protein
VRGSASKTRKKLYRAVIRAYADAPLASRSHTGRFHTEKGSATYLAASPGTAWKEVLARLGAKREHFLVIEVEVEVDKLKVVDLTDPAVQAKYHVNTNLLIDVDHGPCQALAVRLRAEGIQAIWTFSRADYPEGRQLVIFLDLVDADACIHMVN